MRSRLGLGFGNWDKVDKEGTMFEAGHRTGIRYVFATAMALVLVAVSAEAAVQGVLTKRRVNEYDAVAGRNGGNRYLAWTQAPASKFNRTKVMARRNGNTFRVSRKGTRAYTGGLFRNTLIYQEIRPNRNASNLFGFNLDKKNRSAYRQINSPWWEYSPTRSGRWVLFSRDRNRTRSVILFNLKSGNGRQLTEIRRRGFRQATAGQVNGKWAVYHRCVPTRCDVFRYNIKTKNKTRIPRTRTFQYYPSVARDGTVYFATSGNACGANVKLMRRGNGRTRQIAYLGNKDTFRTYVAPAAGGKVDVIFDKYGCTRDGSDVANRPRANVYKVRVN